MLLLLILCCLVANSVSRDTFESAEPIINMVTVVSGESIVLPCGVDPDNYQLHKLTARWQQLSEDRTPQEINDQRFSTQKDGSLLVKNVQLDDEGRYLCVDNSTLDTVAEFDIRVRKRSVVMASSEPSSGGLHEGDTLLVRCNVLTGTAGQAATLLVWRDSALIGQRSDPRVTLVTQRGQKNSWQLIVRNVTRADAGRYICRAKTYYDSAEASIQVTVAPLVAADCTTNSTKVRWSALSPSVDGYMVRLLVEERLMDAVLLANHVTSVEVQHLTAGSRVKFQVEPQGHASAMGSTSCVIDGASISIANSSSPANSSSSPQNNKYPRQKRTTH